MNKDNEQGGHSMNDTRRRGLDAAFGGTKTTLSEQREIWL